LHVADTFTWHRRANVAHLTEHRPQDNASAVAVMHTLNFVSMAQLVKSLECALIELPAVL
jgi:hypothetical protein